MYASGNSQCFTEISNFQELRFATPASENGSPTHEHEQHSMATNNNATTTMPNHISFHFTATADEKTESNEGESELAMGQCIPEPSTSSHDAISLKLPKFPERFSFGGFSQDPQTDSDAPQEPQSQEPSHCKESIRGGFSSPPPEELLGSVTEHRYPTGSLENGRTLRTSARVKHKMRMDSIRSGTPPLTERKEPQAKPASTTLTRTPNQGKQMRVVWSNHDKNLFFEALNEYGKDFEAIVNYLNTKKRRKDNGEHQVFKAKDVRNLYYQFNQKIVKYIHFSDEVKKKAQELYALINYGEMRRKVPFQNKKYFHKLKDLVYKGFTTVREKGKNIRIKTPSCRALRQLNQLEEGQEDIKLPPRIDVLLKPSTMEAWGRVQSLAQNPRVRITVPIQKRLSVLMQFFQQKWRAQDVRLVERLDEIKHLSTSVSSKLTRQRMQHEIQLYSQMVKRTETADCERGQVLRFAPAQNAVIHRPMINLTELQSNTSICLNSYEQRIGVKVPGETLCAMEKLTGCKERLPMGGRRQRSDSGSEKALLECKKVKYEDGGKEFIGEEKPASPFRDLLDHQADGHFKSPNASNESMELKDIDCCYDSQYTPNGLDYETIEALKDYESNDDSVKGQPSGGLDALVGRQSDNSSDGFALLDMDLQLSNRYHCVDTAESSAGEEPMKVVGNESEETGNEISSITTTTTTTMTTSIKSNSVNSSTTVITMKKKKKYRRKGESIKPTSNAQPSINHWRPLMTEEQIQRIRDGWTLGNVGDFTVGDLYIMFGTDLKLEVEYEWIREEELALGVIAHRLQVTSHNGKETEMDGGEQQDATQADLDVKMVMPAEAIPDGSSVEDDNLRGLDVKEETKEQRRCPVDTISGRLKQLLFLVNLDNKDTKKKCMHSNTIDRKPKPIPPRYRQSRWWRTRVNRQHTLHPMLPNLIRTPPSATITSSFVSTADKSVTVGTSMASETDGNYLEQRPTLNLPVKYVELSTDTDVRPTNTDTRISHLMSSAIETTTNDQTTLLTSSKNTLRSTPSKNSTSEVLPNDLSCLSLFDLSLPSTSSSMMADLFSDHVPTSTGPPTQPDQKLLEGNLNELSLTGLFGSLEPALSPACPPLPSTDLDVDFSVLSESTVDYIARFQDIAAEFRAQQQP
uniref:SANT domain-containing protein n=1 Tax=Anopheles farauti TaxID=69004 RepID=A0A182QC80_9DIPT